MRHTYIALALLLALGAGAAFFYEPPPPRQELAELTRLQSATHNQTASPQEYLRERKRLIGETSVPDLIALLRDPDPAVRMSALQLLGAKGGPEALEALRDVHRRGEGAMRLAAVHAIAQIGDAPALIEILHSDVGGPQAAVALGRLKAGVPDLAVVLADESDVSRACHAAAALAEIGTPEARHALESFHAENSTLRRAVERALLKESR
jgi:HEAT repeat protein